MEICAHALLDSVVRTFCYGCEARFLVGGTRAVVDSGMVEHFRKNPAILGAIVGGHGDTGVNHVLRDD
jgi:hypothetical protein